MSFYIIRKLIESGKVDRVISGLNFVLDEYPIKNGVTPFNPRTLAFAYDLFKGSKATLNLRKLCEQFIHSRIFWPFTFKPFRGDMLGVYFASDCQSKTGLYYITLVKVIEIILSAGQNRPIKLKLVREANGSFKVNLRLPRRRTALG